MKAFNCATSLSDPKTSWNLCVLFTLASLIFAAYFMGTAVISKDYKQRILRWGMADTMQHTHQKACKGQCRPLGSEALPEKIVATTSNLETRPLWGSFNNKLSRTSKSLLAIAVGVKQKKVVSHIIEQFLSSDFAIMLFHYDGFVDEWRNLEWSSHVIHVSVMNQTKWWFAKRFLHPDIVAEYDYIFLWDEDLGVENFHPRRYLSIVKDEGLEISQPALDTDKSDIHHLITARLRDAKVHRRMYKLRGKGRCDDKSTAPPCVGWVEMMAPVFSRAAWRCVWYMIQNDLIHAWGIDEKLGYCAQGDRTRNVGVVDSEYIVHLGLPTLGFPNGTKAQAPSRRYDDRIGVRRQSFIEMQIFKKRWKSAVMEDICWVDPYKDSTL